MKMTSFKNQTYIKYLPTLKTVSFKYFLYTWRGRFCWRSDAWFYVMNNYYANNTNQQSTVFVNVDCWLAFYQRQYIKRKINHWCSKYVLRKIDFMHNNCENIKKKKDFAYFTCIKKNTYIFLSNYYVQRHVSKSFV